MLRSLLRHIRLPRKKSDLHSTALELNHPREPEHYLRRIEQRIQSKVQNDKPLSVVEAYFAKHRHVSHAGALAPSALTIVQSLLRHCARPMAILTLGVLIIAAESTSLALFTDKTSDTYTEQDGSEDFASFASLNLAALMPTKKAKKAWVPEDSRGLVEFITGVIAVYLPSEKNPAEIAELIVAISDKEDIDPIFVASLIA